MNVTPPATTLDPNAMVQLAHMLLTAAKSPLPDGSAPSALHATPPARQPLVLEVVLEMIAWKSGRGLTAEYLNLLSYSGKRFASWFKKPLADLKTEDVRQYIDTMQGSARTKNNTLTHIRTIVNFAMSRRYLPGSFDELRWVERCRNEVDKDVGIYTPEEISRILSFAGKGRAAIAIQAFAGLRTAEVCRLDWKDVDLERGFILVTAVNAKTRQKRLVPISANLAEWLRPLRKVKGLIYSGNSDSYCAYGVSTVCVDAGVTRKPNGLRHSFGSYRLATLQDENKLALEMGNSPAMIFRHYRAVVYPDAAKTYWSIVPESVGVTRRQRRVLAFIAANPGCEGQHISKAIYGTDAWVTGGRMAARLRDNGLVTLEASPVGLGPRYWLTDAGRVLLAQDALSATPTTLPTVSPVPEKLAA